MLFWLIPQFVQEHTKNSIISFKGKWLAATALQIFLLLSPAKWATSGLWENNKCKVMKIDQSAGLRNKSSWGWMEARLLLLWHSTAEGGGQRALLTPLPHFVPTCYLSSSSVHPVDERLINSGLLTILWQFLSKIHSTNISSRYFMISPLPINPN